MLLRQRNSGPGQFQVLEQTPIEPAFNRKVEEVGYEIGAFAPVMQREAVQSALREMSESLRRDKAPDRVMTCEIDETLQLLVVAATRLRKTLY